MLSLLLEPAVLLGVAFNGSIFFEVRATLPEQAKPDGDSYPRMSGGRPAADLRAPGRFRTPQFIEDSQTLETLLRIGSAALEEGIR